MPSAASGIGRKAGNRMNPQKIVLLDRDGDAIVPKGYEAVSTERAFLSSVGKGPLLVKGRKLCNWALRICRSRDWEYQEVQSPTEALRDCCPGLTKENASKIANVLDERFVAIKQPIMLRDLLVILFPDGPWVSQPSHRHAAEWLLWLADSTHADYMSPLLAQICGEWKMRSFNKEASIYKMSDPEKAKQALRRWLRIDLSHPLPDFGRFPLDEVPDTWINEAHASWSAHITVKGTGFFRELASCGVPADLVNAAANLVFEFYSIHKHLITEDEINQLSGFLDDSQIGALRQLKPPAIPCNPPSEYEEVIQWFTDQYLPYRAWQVEFGDSDASNAVIIAAKRFAQWYLEQYAVAIAGGIGKSRLAVTRAEGARRHHNKQVTLWVILDGLHYEDSVRLARKITGPRMALDEHVVAFSTIPTVTCFAKPALLSGLPPMQAVEKGEDILPEGAILLKESKDPALLLQKAKPGDLFVWMLQEPDNTYHKRNDRTTTRANIRAELEKIAQRIRRAAMDVPDSLSLRVIIGTDHGRMMGTSVRKYTIPDGMNEAHGRSAWGDTSKVFPQSGIISDDNIAWLSRDRYALPYDCAILLDGDAYTMSDGKTGIEEFTHGGLFPEEVLTPWIEFTRDRVTPVMECHASGKAKAGQTGIINLLIHNPSPLTIDLTSLQLRLPGAGGRSYDVSKTHIGPYSSCNTDVAVSDWPAKSILTAAEVVVIFQMPDGTPFSAGASSQLESEELYSRGIDLMLEDL